MRVAPTVTIPETDRETLQKWSRGRAVPARLVERARIVLSAGEGKQNVEIADELGIIRDTVQKWRDRYIDLGLKGIQQDAPRPGRPRELSKELEARIVETTAQPPPNATHWSVRRLARHLRVPPATVQRVWKRHDLKPHLVRTFKLSKDPHFVEKLEDVVGLYLDPPDKALVLSLDEKSQIQALDRTRPLLPVRPGLPAHQTFDYKRHGTTTLFAALDLLTGAVITKFRKRHRHQEFITFLNEIDAKTPRELDLHVILDNYGSHKTPHVKRWLKKHPRFHLHFIPTGSSWLNLVERLLRELTTQRIRRGAFRSVPELETAIQGWLDEHNADPKPFKWTATVDEILRKVEKYRRTYDTLH
jgi:transposase